VAALFELLLAGVTVTGMISGSTRQFSGGTSAFSQVIWQEVVGAVCLILIALGLSCIVEVWCGRGPSRASVLLSFAVLPCWLVWAGLWLAERAS
jgi:hypothetical protein